MEEKIEKGANENLQLMKGANTPAEGTVGLKTQLGGESATVSEAANSTGGVKGGNFVEPDIDDELFKFNSDDTPLMNLMLKAKKVAVKSPVVDHYMIDEQRAVVTVATQYSGISATTAEIPMSPSDQKLCQEYGTLLAKGVNGYDPTGAHVTAGKDLLLLVTGRNESNGNPIVRALNGQKENPTDEECYVPTIPQYTKLCVLSNALYETQKNVAPDLIVPQPTEVYLQKRGMNNIVSDYFDSQKKRVPFSKAIVAEAAIRNFKVKGNRTLWAGRKAKIKVQTKIGMQDVYTTEGVRWQFKRELQHLGKWSVEEFIGLTKMFYTGEDVPSAGIILCGKNLLENIQCIDYSKHPEIKIQVVTNPVGWKVTQIHTVFGDLEFKHEPTLDRLGWSNSGAVLAYDRLVHYQYAAEKSFNEAVEGEEAMRSGILVWDALALKGSCHIWIDGEDATTSAGATGFVMWDSEAAPTSGDLVEGRVYYLISDCKGINKDARKGQMWQRKSGAFVLYTGDVYVQ